MFALKQWEGTRVLKAAQLLRELGIDPEDA